MPVDLRRCYEMFSLEMDRGNGLIMAHPGDNPMSQEGPRFLKRAIEALKGLESNPENQRPLGLNKDLLLIRTLLSPYYAEIIKQSWFVSVKSGPETLQERILELTNNIGIAPIYESEYLPRNVMGAKYKPMARKVFLVSTSDPEALIPSYKKIEIGALNKVGKLEVFT